MSAKIDCISHVPTTFFYQTRKVSRAQLFPIDPQIKMTRISPSLEKKTSTELCYARHAVYSPLNFDLIFANSLLIRLTSASLLLPKTNDQKN